MVKLFFSYSHKDEELRNELEIHLSMLKRQNVIEMWHDRRIDAGKEIDREICKYLNDANIILLLVSPYFLASDYCYDIELSKALEMHGSGKAVVIPVILHPCDWHSSLFGKLLATPTDGKPISKYPNQHDAFLNITKSIRKVALKFNNIVSVPQLKILQDKQPEQNNLILQGKPLPRSSNLRIKKEYTDQEKEDFIENTFEYISNYFEGSLNELEIRNLEVTIKFKKIDATHFTASIYKNGKNVSSCKIWLCGINYSTNEIAYSSNISSSDNSMNDSISIKDDSHTLSLKALGCMFGSIDGSDLTQEGAAEYFWEQLINVLQQ
jgi:hypothetical protein